MIKREDMMELSSRMNSARASVFRVAGAYFDEDGYVDGTFNTHFLKLPAGERTRNLTFAKTVLLSKTNEEFREYRIPACTRKPGGIWQLLDGIKESGLKNDAFLDILYELVGEKLPKGEPLACFLYYGQYDIPVKGTDQEWIEDSEEVYTYLLCTVSPLEGEYEPGKPVFGFLYPAFRDRSGNNEYINLFEAQAGKYRELITWLISSGTSGTTGSEQPLILP